MFLAWLYIYGHGQIPLKREYFKQFIKDFCEFYRVHIQQLESARTCLRAEISRIDEYEE